MYFLRRSTTLRIPRRTTLHLTQPIQYGMPFMYRQKLVFSTWYGHQIYLNTIKCKKKADPDPFQLQW
jgi:hypothetical protein